MQTKIIKIDFSTANTLADMHEVLKTSLGFPDFYGRNIHALIDCLTSLRYPEDGMSEFVLLHKEEVAIFEVVNLPRLEGIAVNHFLIAIEAVNQRMVTNGSRPVILLALL